MRRLEVLDGLRGYFLVFMLINHLSFAGGLWLVHVNHAELGFVQDAQGFVFLSGLLVGMVYAGRMHKEGFGGGARRIWHRALELYAWTLGCILAVLVAAQFLPYAYAYWGPWLGQLIRQDGSIRVAAAALVYQPTFMDILPQYIAYLLISPPLVWLVLTGRWIAVAIGSGLLWLAVQLGLHLPLVVLLDQALGLMKPGLSTRAPFNILAWQIVFMSGLVAGALTATGQVDWRRVFRPERTALFKAAVATLAFFMVWRLAGTLGLIPPETAARFAVYEVRGEFSLVFALSFAALAYAAAWLLIAGPQSANRRIKAIAEMGTALFKLPFLRLLGRHSLHVYAWHVVLVYLVIAFDWFAGPFDQITKTVLTGVALLLLALPSVLRESNMSDLVRPLRLALARR